VQFEGLACANDLQVWEHARLNGFAIVSKDADYNNLRTCAKITARSLLLTCWA
jgi:predicted nuclease of predicted toxin-antitoxin system